MKVLSKFINCSDISCQLQNKPRLKADAEQARLEGVKLTQSRSQEKRLMQVTATLALALRSRYRIWYNKQLPVKWSPSSGHVIHLHQNHVLCGGNLCIESVVCTIDIDVGSPGCPAQITPQADEEA